MANKKIVTAKSIVEEDIPYVYDHCIEVLWEKSEFNQDTKVLSEKHQEIIRKYLHQLSGNIGNKTLSITMNDDDLETKSEKLHFLAGKASEKTVEVYEDLKHRISKQNKIPNDVAAKTVVVCADKVFKRGIDPMQQTVSAYFEKQELNSFKSSTQDKQKVASA